MKKHDCPYLNSQNRCTHNKPGSSKKLPDCPYSNNLKCKLYNEWLKQERLTTTADRAIEELLLNEREGYYD